MPAAIFALVTAIHVAIILSLMNQAHVVAGKLEFMEVMEIAPPPPPPASVEDYSTPTPKPKDPLPPIIAVDEGDEEFKVPPEPEIVPEPELIPEPEPIPIPEPPKPEPEKPKPVEKPKPKPEPKPKPKPEPKPVPKPEPKPELAPTPAPPAPPAPVTSPLGEAGSSSTVADSKAIGATGTASKSQSAGKGSGGSGVDAMSSMEVGRRISANTKYPKLSKERGEQGTVKLKCLVGPNGGNPSEVIVVKSSGSSRLDSAAQKSAQGYKFSAAKRDGVGVSHEYVFDVVFKLR